MFHRESAETPQLHTVAALQRGRYFVKNGTDDALASRCINSDFVIRDALGFLQAQPRLQGDGLFRRGPCSLSPEKCQS
jgi:hypothetical protein